MPPPSRWIRWLIVALLFGISFSSYVERSNLSVAAELMMPALSLSKMELGALFNAFLIGYALFQIPAGWLGDRYGPRLVLGISALLWGLLTLGAAVLPGRVPLRSISTVALLWILRFLLGAAEASTFPVAARAIHHSIEPARRGLANSMMLLGSSVASALTAPFVSWTMSRYGWRASLCFTAVVPVFVAVLWLRFAPRGQPAPPPRLISCTSRSRRRWFNASIALLSLSYASEGYLLFTFLSWLYIYLVEIRNFSLVRGGFAASLPWVAAIAATPLGGQLSDLLTIRFGRFRSAQVLIAGGYSLCGILLLVAAETPQRLVALLALCISLAALYLAESSFWTVATTVAGEHASLVAALMNTIGILGGIASTSAVPFFLHYYGKSGWTLAFGSGTAMALMTAILWLVLGRRSGASPA